jgi:hypothetical protein
LVQNIRAIETIDHQLLNQLFPGELMKYFSISCFEILCDVEMRQEFWVVEFEEKNELPPEYSPSEYESKGFMESKLIQDFPLRGKPVFLRLKKRRWRHKVTGVIVKRDFTFLADGAKFTRDLSDFLKGTSGYANRYHEQHSKLLRSE